MNFRQTAILLGAVGTVGVVLLVLSFLADDKTPGGDTLTEELVGVKADQIDTVEMERAGGGRLKLVRTDKDKNTWEITEPYRAPADALAITAIINELMKAKPVSSSELSSNPAVHGLEPPSLKITLRQGTERSSTVNLGDVTIGGNKAVVFVTTSARPDRPMAVPRADLDTLFKEPKGNVKAADIAKWVADFRSKTIFPSDPRAGGEDVTALKLTLPNKKKELALTRKPSGGWQFTSPAGWGDADANGDPTPTAATFTGVRRLVLSLASVSAMSAADFIENPKDLKEYGLNADNPDLVRVEMTTRDNQTAVVFIGKREAAPAAPTAPGMPPQPPGNKVYVRVEGQPGVIRATAADLSGLVSVIDNPAPLRERTLVNADRSRVDGLNIVVAGQPADKPTKLRRAGPVGEWMLFGGPNDPQPASGVEPILDVLLAPRTIKDFPAPNPANFATVPVTVFVWADGFTRTSGPTAEPVQKGEPTKIEFGRREGDVVHVRRTRPGGQVNTFTLPIALHPGQQNAVPDVVTAVVKTRLELLSRELPSFSNTPLRISATGAANYAVAREDKPGAPDPNALWRFAPPDAHAGSIADGATVRNVLIYNLANLSSKLDRFVAEAPDAAELAKYGLSPPRLTVTVGLPANTSGDKQFGFEFGKETTDPEKVYARVVGRAAVFTVPRAVYTLLATPDLRDRMAFRALDPAKATKVDLKGWGSAGFITPLVFEKKDGTWVVTTGPAGYAVDPKKVDAFVQMLSKLRVKSFVPGPVTAAQGFGDNKVYLIVDVKAGGETFYVNIGSETDAGASYFGWTSRLPASPLVTFDSKDLRPYKASSGAFIK